MAAPQTCAVPPCVTRMCACRHNNQSLRPSATHSNVRASLHSHAAQLSSATVLPGVGAEGTARGCHAVQHHTQRSSPHTASHLCWPALNQHGALMCARQPHSGFSCWNAPSTWSTPITSPTHAHDRQRHYCSAPRLAKRRWLPPTRRLLCGCFGLLLPAGAPPVLPAAGVPGAPADTLLPCEQPVADARRVD
jgi:hypothetical protein